MGHSLKCVYKRREEWRRKGIVGKKGDSGDLCFNGETSSIIDDAFACPAYGFRGTGRGVA